MENVKVIIWGLGAMGGGMADMLLKKKALILLVRLAAETRSARACTTSLKLPGETGRTSSSERRKT